MPVWPALLGPGLAPVMVGATEVVAGNAPLELSGVSPAVSSRPPCRSRGSLGTAVPGAVMSAKAGSDFAENWADAELPPLPPDHLGLAEQAVEVGMAPLAPGTPQPVAAQITEVTHDTSVSGVGTAFTVAGIVAVVAAAVALFTQAR
ncbi:hypothetical protein [Streptomyces sp. HNM0645]|uniref:hypothetical protein n=1 Tax=Streptomyces sp. HNM0645 TaxID=2782343 RepID=UPI0032D5ABDB